MVNKNEGPAKIFVETAHARIIEGTFNLLLQSGSEKYAFAIPLPLVKTLGLGIAEQLAEIEKKTGHKIPDGTIEKNVLSPWSGK